jgi:hypothetical protein
MRVGKTLMVVVLAIEGFLLLRPDGALVQAARRGEHRTVDLAGYWWRKSPVHMGCSVVSCTRPATRTATYRQPGPRGTTWRAYGFCEFHHPPDELEGLVYRQGQPPRPGYDVPLTTLWSETYFLLGIFAFAMWCACMWRYVNSARRAVWLSVAALHASILSGLLLF